MRVLDFPIGETLDTWYTLLDHETTQPNPHRIRLMTKVVSEEVALQEMDVDRTFAAQDFLILGLQSLNHELDAQKNAKNALRGAGATPTASSASATPTSQQPVPRMSKRGIVAPPLFPVRSTTTRTPTSNISRPSAKSKSGARTSPPRKVSTKHSHAVTPTIGSAPTTTPNSPIPSVAAMSTCNESIDCVRLPESLASSAGRAEDDAWQKTEPYRNIIAVLEQKVAALEGTEEKLQDTQRQLKEALEDKQILKSRAEKDAAVAREELQSLQQIVDSKREQASDMTLRQEAEARLCDEMNCEIARLRTELVQLQQSTAEQNVALEADLQQRSVQLTHMKEEKEEVERAWQADQKAYAEKESELRARIHSMEQDASSGANSQSRLIEARRETRRKEVELENTVAQFEEYRHAMERQAANEREYLLKIEAKEEACRRELARRTENDTQHEHINHSLTRDSHEMAQRLAILEHRAQLNASLEDRLAEKNADMRLLQTEQIELQHKFAQEMHHRKMDQDRLLALEERNAALNGELRAAEAHAANASMINAASGVVPSGINETSNGTEAYSPYQSSTSTAVAGAVISSGLGTSPGFSDGMHEELDDVRAELDMQKRACERLQRELERSTSSSKDGPPCKKSPPCPSGRLLQLAQPRLHSQSGGTSSSASFRDTASSVKVLPLRTPVLKSAKRKLTAQSHSTPDFGDLDELVGEIKNNIAMYVPVKHDAVDQNLGLMINTYQPPVPFFRLQAGVYLFGSRKVMVKLVTGNKLVFRVGGGFCSFHEFVETFAREELEKMEEECKLGDSGDDSRARLDGSFSSQH